MEWNLDQLETFLAAAETGSFSAAGRRRGRVQSVISTQIAMLEADLGVELFDRAARLPKLTPAGAELLGEAREILRQCRFFENRAQAMGLRPEEATLRLALDEGLPYFVMPKAFSGLAERFPHTTVRFTQGFTSDIHAMVESGKVHMAVAFDRSEPHDPDIEVRRLDEVDQLLVVRQEHPLASMKRVTRTELAKHRQVVVQSSPGEANSPPFSPLHWITNTSFSAVNLVLQGVGWAVVPDIIARYEGNPPGLVILEPTDMHFPVLNIVSLRREADGPAAAAWLADHLQQVFHQG